MSRTYPKDEKEKGIAGAEKSKLKDWRQELWD